MKEYSEINLIEYRIGQVDPHCVSVLESLVDISYPWNKAEKENKNYLKTLSIISKK